MEKDHVFQQTLQFIAKLHEMEDHLLLDVTGLDLTGQQKNLLSILYLSGPTNLSALSECTHMNMPNCSREVKKLVQKGYIRKEGSPLDKRITELSLTTPGQGVVKGVLERVKDAYFRQTGEWDKDRIERVSSALGILEKDLLLQET